MIESNLAPIVLAFCLGLSIGVSLSMLFQSRAAQLRHKLAEGGLRLTDSAGNELGREELMGLVASNLSTVSAGSRARLLVIGLGAALVAAVMVIALV